jgi:antitoxin HicB
MDRNDIHPIGSSFESFLEEEGLLEAVDEAAIKEVIAWQVEAGMSAMGMTKTGLAAAMQTSRSQVDRLLDPANTSISMHTLFRAASVLGKTLRIELTDRNEQR